jgi:hypothetical protein
MLYPHDSLKFPVSTVEEKYEYESFSLVLKNNSLPILYASEITKFE